MKHKFTSVFPLALGVAVGLATGAAGASVQHDISLFLNENTQGDLPNVLIMIDNSANWNSTINDTTKKKMEHRALYDVLTSCEMRGGSVSEAGECIEGDPIINVGIMTFASGNSPRGGKVMSAVAPLTSTRQQHIAELLYEGGDPTASEKLPGTNNAPYAMLLNEAYRYVAGLTPAAGTQDGNHDPAAIDTETQKYKSPASGCGKNYAILLGNGEPDSGENKTAEETLVALDAMLPAFPLSLDPNTFESNWADEFAFFLAGRDLNGEIEGTQFLVTHVIDAHEHLDPPEDATNPHQEDPDFGKGKFDGARVWLANIAKEGDGRYFSVSNTADIHAALQKILDDLVATNSVYASTTLPVSVNVRGTHLNQVYMGVFRPDDQNRTRWLGNLKMYHMALDNGSLYLADVNGDPVEDAVNGFVVSSAESFWTSESSFWAFSPRGVPPSASDLPDGAVVEKGGAGQHLRENFAGASARKIFTCNECSSLQTFDNAAVSAADLGAADATERDNIITWIRGGDLEDEDKDALTDDARATIHGDVLHSRPAVINYNRYGDDNDIVAYYGANEGIFHAVKGGKGPTGTYQAGDELWGFIPGEVLDRLKKLYVNDQTGVVNKQYFMDGGIGVYQHDANNDGKLVKADGDKAYLYVGMRRGGRFIYALDVSDPEDPRLLWKKNAEDTVSDPEWGELGQTWSLPQVVTSAVETVDEQGQSQRSLRPLLIFGAGYDDAKEDAIWDDPYPAGLPTMGRGIFIADAITGDLLWQAGPNPSGAAVNKTVADMLYSMPSDITAIDLNGDASVDRLYIGDTGGQIWRVDVASQEPADWTVHKLASLVPHDADGRPTSLYDHRKFLYAPDVVWNKDEGYIALLIGSGDREKPSDEYNENRFYMLKDPDTSTTIAAEGTIATITESDLFDATDNTIQDGATEEERQAAETTLNSKKGWYITLGVGEKVVSDAVTINGTTVFNTNQPDQTTNKCEQLGIARVYQISYEDATATTDNDGVAGLDKGDRYGVIAGGGYPPPPVPIVVEIDGEIVEGISIGPVTKKGSDTQLHARERAYWFKEYD